MTLFNRILSSHLIRVPRKFFHLGEVKFDLFENDVITSQKARMIYRKAALIPRRRS